MLADSEVAGGYGQQGFSNSAVSRLGPEQQARSARLTDICQACCVGIESQKCLAFIHSVLTRLLCNLATLVQQLTLSIVQAKLEELFEEYAPAGKGWMANVMSEMPGHSKPELTRELKMLGLKSGKLTANQVWAKVERLSGCIHTAGDRFAHCCHAAGLQ